MKKFVVSKPVGSRRYPARWEPIATVNTLAEAEAIATKQVRGALYTEPGYGLDRAFFGSESSDFWSAMIEPVEDDKDA